MKKASPQAWRGKRQVEPTQREGSFGYSPYTSGQTAIGPNSVIPGRLSSWLVYKSFTEEICNSGVVGSDTFKSNKNDIGSATSPIPIQA